MERIEKMRKVRGKVQYLIRWKGYAAADNTWEPADSIMDSKLLIPGSAMPDRD